MKSIACEAELSYILASCCLFKEKLLPNQFIVLTFIPACKKSQLKMKRQGRQHGMVRTYPIMSEPRRKQRSLNESPTTAGLFAKVCTKPSNHSKFTGKCGRSRCYACHIHPASKSKDKVKGAQKLRSSSDVVSNYRLITWRVVDSAPGFKVSGFSATGILDYLDYVDDYDYEGENTDHDYDHDAGVDGAYDQDAGVDGSYDQDYDYDYTYNYNYTYNYKYNYDLEISSYGGGVEIEETDGYGDSNAGVDDDDDDDRMSFCEVGLVWQALDEDESWCWVEEI